MEEIKKLVKETPNDMELGKKIRELVSKVNTPLSEIEDWYVREGK